MKYKLVLSERFKEEFRKLDKYTQRLICSWMSSHIADCPDPRSFGKALTTNRSGQWRYRIGDYRIICAIEDDKLIILALTIGHRKEIYRD